MCFFEIAIMKDWLHRTKITIQFDQLKNKKRNIVLPSVNSLSKRFGAQITPTTK